MSDFIASIAERTGLAERLVARLILVGAVAIALLIAFGGWMIWLRFHDQAVAERDRAASNVRVLRRALEAHEASAVEQARDDRALAGEQREMHDAIHAGADTPPDPAHVRLNCLRLMRAGADTSRIPACRRPARSDGAEAGPDT